MNGDPGQKGKRPEIPGNKAPVHQCKTTKPYQNIPLRVLNLTAGFWKHLHSPTSAKA